MLPCGYTKFVQERFLCCTFPLPLVKVVANMRLGVVVNYHSVVDVRVVCLFWFLLAHEPAALEEHTMELKHLTDFEFFRGLQLLPVDSSLLFVVPTGFYIHVQPDRDYFHTIYYPDRVYSSV